MQQNKNGATPNGRNGTTLPLRKVPNAKEISLRKNLLMRDKKLADQHRILVVEQKCIAEEEFWELRKVWCFHTIFMFASMGHLFVCLFFLASKVIN